MVFDNETKVSKIFKFFTITSTILNRWNFADGSYASVGIKIEPKKEYEWAHSMSDIINSLIDAGLRIEFLNEYPFTVWKQFPFADKGSDCYYHLKNQKAEIPLLFTLKTTK